MSKFEITILKIGPTDQDMLVSRDYMNGEDLAVAVLSALKLHDDILADVDEDLYNRIASISRPTGLDIKAIKSAMKDFGFDLCYGIVDEEVGFANNLTDHVYIDVETNQIYHKFVRNDEEMDYLRYYTEVFNLIHLNDSEFINSEDSKMKRVLDLIGAVEISAGRMTESMIEWVDGLLNELGFIRYIIAK